MLRGNLLDLSSFSTNLKHRGRQLVTACKDFKISPANLVNYERELLDIDLSTQKDQRSGRSFYHAILVQLKLLPDQECSKLIKSLVRCRYMHARDIKDSAKHQRLRENARGCLITLQKANLGDHRAMRKVMETAYGQRGPYRHYHLARLASDAVQPAEPLIAGLERSRPPVAGGRLQALWQAQIPRKKLELELPDPPGREFGKPLDRRREANIRWRHHTKLMGKTMPPIFSDQLDRIQRIANGSISLRQLKVPAWRVITLKEMQKRCESHHTDPHTLRPRNMRHLYAALLARSPVLTHTETGMWIARNGL